MERLHVSSIGVYGYSAPKEFSEEDAWQWRSHAVNFEEAMRRSEAWLRSEGYIS